MTELSSRVEYFRVEYFRVGFDDQNTKFDRLFELLQIHDPNSNQKTRAHAFAGNSMCIPVLEAVLAPLVLGIMQSNGRGH